MGVKSGDLPHCSWCPCDTVPMGESGLVTYLTVLGVPVIQYLWPSGLVTYLIVLGIPEDDAVFRAVRFGEGVNHCVGAVPPLEKNVVDIITTYINMLI